MNWFNVFVIVFCTINGVINVVNCDTPGNCTDLSGVLGLWTLSLGPTDSSNPVNCSIPWVATNSIQVNLVYPSTAQLVGTTETGFWTLIYNQGIEIRISDIVYFFFFAYSPDGSTSYCSQNEPGTGWYSEFKENSNFGCFNAAKGGSNIAPIINNNHINRETQIAKLKSLPYKSDKKFVDHINRIQSDWKAVEYPEFEQYSVYDIQMMMGGIPIAGINPVQSVIRAFSAKPRIISPLSSKTVKETTTTIPTSFDWRSNNGNWVSPVRNQGQCGSCYAFASMGMLEARIRIASLNASTPILSTQDAVSCSEYSQGCNGGFPYLTAGKYGHDFGIVEESCFPYTGTDKTPCSNRCNKQSTTVWKTRDYYYIGGYYGASTAELMQLEIMQNGPIAVSFEVYPDFMHYKSGVYTHTNNNKHKLFNSPQNPFVITNHVVVIVGWGETSDGKAYWIVKNSWGTNWGLEGYFWIARSTGVYGGECGIESITVGVDM